MAWYNPMGWFSDPRARIFCDSQICGKEIRSDGVYYPNHGLIYHHECVEDAAEYGYLIGIPSGRREIVSLREARGLYRKRMLVQAGNEV